MAAMVGNVPLAMIRGTGAGLSAAFVLGLLVLLCFSAGYATMSRRVVNTGAFYTYIARALAGRPARRWRVPGGVLHRAPGFLRVPGHRADVRLRQLRGLRDRGAVREGDPRSRAAVREGDPRSRAQHSARSTSPSPSSACSTS